MGLKLSDDLSVSGNLGWNFYFTNQVVLENIRYGITKTVSSAEGLNYSSGANFHKNYRCQESPNSSGDLRAVSQ